MSKKRRHDTSFTFESLIRLIVFGVILYIAITFLSGQKSTIKIDTNSDYLKPVFDKITPTVNNLKNVVDEKFKQFQRQLITKFSTDLVNSIK